MATVLGRCCLRLSGGSLKRDVPAICAGFGSGFIDSLAKRAELLVGLEFRGIIPVRRVDVSLLENFDEFRGVSGVGGMSPESGKLPNVSVGMGIVCETEKRVPVCGSFSHNQVGRSHGVPGEEGIKKSFQPAFSPVFREESFVQPVEAECRDEGVEFSEEKGDHDDQRRAVGEVEAGEDDKIMEEDEQTVQPQGGSDLIEIGGALAVMSERERRVVGGSGLLWSED